MAQVTARPFARVVPGRIRNALLAGAAAALITAVLAGLIAAPLTVAHAQGATTNFDLDEVRRMMDDLKRRADAARRDTSRESTGAETAADEVGGRTGAADGAGVGTPSLTQKDEIGVRSTVDPEKAALRDKEGEEVLEAIRRARAAREAWDDPDPVLEALPDTPPAPHTSARRPISVPRDKGLPRPGPEPHETNVLHPDPEAAPLARDADSRRRSLGGPLPRFEAGPKPRIEPAPRRVTVLLVMDVGGKGIRRWSKTADPMLCVHEYCFLSRGPDKSAVRHSRRVAFGPGVALGQRGLACRSSPACVFRNIDLGAAEARLQPIDLKILRHDRREAELVRADETCALEAGELVCEQPVVGKTWRAWIIPETVAEEAGTRALKRALANGLSKVATFEARGR